jgi:hypothetical protein
MAADTLKMMFEAADALKPLRCLLFDEDEVL